MEDLNQPDRQQFLTGPGGPSHRLRVYQLANDDDEIKSLSVSRESGNKDGGWNVAACWKK